jgi:integrase
MRNQPTESPADPGRFKVDAERWLRAQESARDRGDWRDPRQGLLPLREVAGRWLTGTRPTLKATTADSYEELLRTCVVPMFGDVKIGAIQPSDVQAWVGALSGKGLSPSRVRKAAIVLRLVLTLAVRDGLIMTNPVVGVRLPKLVRREATYFETDTVDAISDAMPAPYDTLVRLLGTLRLRWGEAAALRTRSVDLLHRRLRVSESVSEVKGRLVFDVPKTHATRSVPLPTRLATELEGLLSADPQALLFTGPRGGVLRYSWFYHRLWRPTLAQLEVPAVGLHTLRHSAAARLVAAGASAKAIQSILGHSSAAFSLTVYGHLFDSDLDALADRLDAPRTFRGLADDQGSRRQASDRSDQDERSGPPGTRTLNQRIKSPVLCQLS